MNREQVKSMLPILQAYAEGKTIQFFGESGVWSDFAQKASPNFDEDPSRYRIKSQPKYRPFKGAEECWQEMQKHQPFGWVYSSQSCQYKQILSVEIYGDAPVMVYGQGEFTLNDMMETYTFADGEPFGMKV